MNINAVMLEEQIKRLISKTDDVYFSKAEVAIGKHEGRIITISVYSKTECEDEGIELLDKNESIRVSQ